ncbi:MAG TPA: patatin-like phospholipase family protein [Flavobacterium sp.]|jgi:NTE family protein|nr:patatin-like phospholipase family protein [Flavobacterium sp.]
MKKIVLLFIALLAFVFSHAQKNQQRPKVGLVLSGGGAKGFAHIGVLKVLEQAGVKIDYIGGTSMGAVVGGLYASGYNASQIDSIFKETDFDALLSDFIPRSSKNFYEKRNDELYAFTLPFNKMRIGIPTALSRGMYNYNLLNKLTYKVRHVRDFNKLPIPFLCMASNIENGEEVLLNKGYLAQAILASGAFPTLFSPVEIDGKLLVDGGVTNNYPVEEIKKLGADIVIGVDVQDDLKDRKSLKDATRILVQISNLSMIEKMREKIKMTDIYIKPDITNYGVISFDEGQEIIKRGEEAAFAVYDKIKPLGDSTMVKFDKYPKVKVDSLNIKNIIINPLDNYTRSYVIGKLRFKQGAKVSYNDIKVGMDNITATQNFSSIGYTLEKNQNGDDLVMTLHENPTTTFLRFALHYDGLYKSGILVNLTQKKTFFKNDITSVDMILGDNLRYNLDYYIDNGFYWSFGFKSRFNAFNRNIDTDFKDGSLYEQLGIRTINYDFSDFTNQMYLQTIFVQKFLLGAGVEQKHLKVRSKTLGSSSPIFENSDYTSIFGYLKYDSFDNRYFPRRGWYFSGDFQSYLYSSSNDFNQFSVARGDIGFARTLYKKLTVRWQSEAGFAIGGESSQLFDFALGGYGYQTINNFKHFYGYDFLSVSGDSYIKTALTLDYEIFKKNHLNIAANFANVADNLYETTDWFSQVKYSGYALGYGLETIVGPIEFKYSCSPELNKGFAWFSVGFWF